ncbi:MAG TPA: MFS transporter [Pirellulaceae bacterium]|nr:MFS transporter [Pirellulaceae bacterium]
MTNPAPDIFPAQLAEADQRPTRVRYWIIGLTCAMSVLLYLDRFCIVPVTDTIIKDLNLDRAMFGWAIGLFFWSYALMQVPSGWICDRFGSRYALPLYVIAWSIATMLLGFAHTLEAFVILRILLGAAQAGAYPAAAGYIKKWIPVTGRARANSIVSMGGRAGGMLANSITTLLMIVAASALAIATEQWRAVFIFYGLLGLIWAALFWWQFRERPADHPACNAAELALVESSAPPKPGISLRQTLESLQQKFSRLPRNPFRAVIFIVAMIIFSPPVKFFFRLMIHRNVILLSAAGVFVNWGWIFLVSWMPSYLKDAYSGQMGEAAASVLQWLNASREALGYDPIQSTGLEPFELLGGPLTALTGVAGVCGCITGGILADILLRRLGPIWGRRVPGMCAATIAACAYGVSLLATDIWVFVGLMAAASFFIDVGLGALWATYQDFGGKYVASVLGFANMCGNLAAGVGGIVYGQYAKTHQWSTVFAIAGSCLLCVAVCWLFVDPTRKFVVEETQ